METTSESNTKKIVKKAKKSVKKVKNTVKKMKTPDTASEVTRRVGRPEKYNKEFCAKLLQEKENKRFSIRKICRMRHWESKYISIMTAICRHGLEVPKLSPIKEVATV